MATDPKIKQLLKQAQTSTDAKFLQSVVDKLSTSEFEKFRPALNVNTLKGMGVNIPWDKPALTSVTQPKSVPAFKTPSSISKVNKLPLPTTKQVSQWGGSVPDEWKFAFQKPKTDVQKLVNSPIGSKVVGGSVLYDPAVFGMQSTKSGGLITPRGQGETLGQKVLGLEGSKNPDIVQTALKRKEHGKVYNQGFMKRTDQIVDKLMGSKNVFQAIAKDPEMFSKYYQETFTNPIGSAKVASTEIGFAMEQARKGNQGFRGTNQGVVYNALQKQLSPHQDMIQKVGGDLSKLPQVQREAMNLQKAAVSANLNSTKGMLNTSISQMDKSINSLESNRSAMTSVENRPLPKPPSRTPLPPTPSLMPKIPSLQSIGESMGSRLEGAMNMTPKTYAPKDGLERAIFKALDPEYKRTLGNKLLGMNKGLRNISSSIQGRGVLGAAGSIAMAPLEIATNVTGKILSSDSVYEMGRANRIPNTRMIRGALDGVAHAGKMAASAGMGTARAAGHAAKFFSKRPGLVGAAALVAGVAGSFADDVQNTSPQGEMSGVMKSLPAPIGLAGMAYLSSRDRTNDLQGADLAASMSKPNNPDGPMTFGGGGSVMGGGKNYQMGATGNLALSLSNLRRGR